MPAIKMRKFTLVYSQGIKLIMLKVWCLPANVFLTLFVGPMYCGSRNSRPGIFIYNHQFIFFHINSYFLHAWELLSIYFRWPRLLAAIRCDEDVSGLDKSPQWLSLAQQRSEISAKVQTELNLMSKISYPHGEPSLASIEALVSSSNYFMLEDKLLEILFHSHEYIPTFNIDFDHFEIIPYFLILIAGMSCWHWNIMDV